MTQSSKTEVLGFDEWWKTESLNTFDYPKEAAESGFEAGQQSRQDEIDDLIIQLADMKSRLNDSYTAGQTSMYKTKQIEIGELQNKLKSTKQSADEVIGAMSISIYKRNKENESLNQVVDELQKRIGDALKELELIYFYKTQNSNNAIKILKGNQDDLL